MAAAAETDVISAVLRAIRLDAAFFFNAEFSAPWTVRNADSSQVARLLSPSAERLIVYHLVIDGGSAYVRLGDGPRVPLTPGDILMFPHGDPHWMGGGAGINLIPCEDTIRHWKEHGLRAACMGGGGETVKLVCGYLVCEPRLSKVVLAALPRMIRVNIREHSSCQWLENSIRFSVLQASTADPSRHVVLTRLSEAVFVETIRLYIQNLPPEQSGWIGGVRDPEVGRALALLHRDPKHSWTIGELASAIGTSRSVLAERFTLFLGEPPISYLTRWRLQLGSQLLAETDRSVAEIAAQVGYESEPAFNRAFKRTFELPPARYRSKLKHTRTGV